MAEADEVGYLALDEDDPYLKVVPDAIYDNKGPSIEGNADGYLAVEMDWLSEQWDLLKDQPWFRGHMHRQEAIEELQPTRAGTFVVRVSSEPGHYAISTKQDNGNIEHMLILPSWAGYDTNAPGNTRYRLGTYSKLLFNTVPKLIAYYIAHPYIEHHRLVGEVLPEKQNGGYLDVAPDF